MIHLWNIVIKDKFVLCRPIDFGGAMNYALMNNLGMFLIIRLIKIVLRLAHMRIFLILHSM